MSRLQTHRWLALAGPVLVLGLWQFSFVSGLASATLLPSPSDTFARLGHLFAETGLLRDLTNTLWRMALGYGAAAIVGVLIGLAIGSFRNLFSIAELPVDFLRSLPVTALYPIFVLSLGIGDASKIGMVFAASVFVIIVNCAYGVLNSPETRQTMAKLYGANARQRFLWITFFDALPQTLVGLRVALSYALIVEIVAEMFMGSQSGIGQRIFEAYSSYAIADLYAIILVTGLIGYALNQAFAIAERRLVYWGRR